jgi:hypothetical protein
MVPWGFIILGWIVPVVVCWLLAKEGWHGGNLGTLGFIYGGMLGGVGVLFFFAAGGFQNQYMPLVALFIAVVFWLPALLFIALAAIKFGQFQVRKRNSN